MNAQLARGLGVPVAAAAISFLAGAVVLGIVTLLTTRTQGLVDRLEGAGTLAVRHRRRARRGLCHAVSVLLTPRIGAAALMAFLVAGQLLAGMLVDRAGYLGVAVREISMGRIVGALLLFAGALMIRIY